MDMVCPSGAVVERVVSGFALIGNHQCGDRAWRDRRKISVGKHSLIRSVCRVQ